MSITLLKRNVIVPHHDLNPFQKSFGNESITGVDYIKQYVQSTQQAKKPGDKVYIIEAGTGSGKSAALPPAMIKYGKKIAISVPTRVVAESIPINVIKYNKEFKFGENIGFQTSIQKHAPKRGLLYTTPGTLLQQILTLSSEEFMKKYSIIMIDEVHQHQIVEDFLLSSLKKLLINNYTNKDCPMVFLLSATMDKKKYMDYFNTTHYIHVKGLDSQKINEYFPDSDVDDVLEYSKSIIKKLPEKGDTLIFLPSISLIKKWATGLDTDREVFQAYSANMENVTDLFVSEGKRGRIILATNAAETGVTFPYLVNIIDTGTENFVSFNPVYKATVLVNNAITYGSAMQRRGRVGRVRPGNYYPCYTKSTLNKLIREKFPDILTGDFTQELLNYIILESNTSIKDDKLVVENSVNIGYLNLINNPSIETLTFSLEKLYILGLINKKHKPTYFGYLAGVTMQKFSLENKKSILFAYMHYPHLAKFLVMMACCMVNGVFTKFKYSSGFFNYIYTFQLIQNYINYEVGVDIKSIKKYIEEDLQFNYNKWIYTIELYYETIENLISSGLPIQDAYRDSFFSDLSDTDIINMKHCIYEGYKINMIVNKKTIYKNIDINVEEDCIVDNLIFRNMEFKAGFSKLDISDLLIRDEHFLY